MSLLAQVVRSGYVEGYHEGAVLALHPDGTDALALGEVERPWFPRSSNKPLQAVALLEAGWEPASGEQLALACASHSGEPGHLEVVRGMLADPDELGCPADLPLSQEAAHALLRAGGAASPLTMNCSGKHAAMLATCRARGWSSGDYLSPSHPVQLAIAGSLARQAGEPVRHVAVDGCGAPQHALSLRGLARAYAGLVAADRTPAQRDVAAAMRAHPWHVGGTDRDVTALMAGVPGLVAKDGAEGVYAAVTADGGVVVLKIADGAARARTPVLVAALRRLGVEAPVLDELATTPVLGGGRPVGQVEVAGALLAAIRG